jgi:hypothetical protein
MVVKTDDAIISATPCNLMAILVDAEHANWEIELTDSATTAGTNVLELGGEATGGQTFFNFTKLGGVAFPLTGIFAEITASSAHFTFWVD